MRFIVFAAMAGAVLFSSGLSWAGEGELLGAGAVETVQTSVAPGHRTFLGPFVSISTSCRKIADSRAWIVEAPRYGKAAVIKKRGDIAFGAESRYSRCNDRPVSGTTVQYTPPPGFSGDDTFAFSLRFSDGETRTRRVNIHVE